MKSLYESILDTEDELIGRVKQNSKDLELYYTISNDLTGDYNTLYKDVLKYCVDNGTEVETWGDVKLTSKNAYVSICDSEKLLGGKPRKRIAFYIKAKGFPNKFYCYSIWYDNHTELEGMMTNVKGNLRLSMARWVSQKVWKSTGEDYLEAKYERPYEDYKLWRIDPRQVEKLHKLAKF